MRFQKQLLGFVVFIAVFSSVICVYEYLYGPLGFGPFVVERRVEPPAAVTAPPADTPAVAYDVRLVSLDFINGKGYTTLSLKLRPGQPAPEKLLVNTRFYVPGDESQNWTTTAGVTRLSAAGDRVEVTVASDCYWCDRPDTPRDGYYADVYVTAQYEGETLPQDSDGYPVEAAVPVVVQAERGAAR